LSQYVKSTDFAAKDSMISGNPAKIVTGTAHDTEYNNIATAVATKADLNSPILVTPALGTPSSGVLTNCTGTPALVGTNFTGTAAALSIGGNADTATKLATARNIGGTSFDGTGNITPANATNATNATNVTGSGTVSATATGGAALTPTSAANALLGGFYGASWQNTAYVSGVQYTSPAYAIAVKFILATTASQGYFKYTLAIGGATLVNNQFIISAANNTDMVVVDFIVPANTTWTFTNAVNQVISAQAALT
jgi:hypothetical protein